MQQGSIYNDRLCIVYTIFRKINELRRPKVNTSPLHHAAVIRYLENYLAGQTVEEIEH